MIHEYTQSSTIGAGDQLRLLKQVKYPIIATGAAEYDKF